ncbi:MAG: RNA polymerase sigma factor [Pseudomonadota bacterium]
MIKPASSTRPQSDALFDELLVMTAQTGDRRAFERLHTRWNARLARAALRYTGNPESARDLSQECWLAVWKGIGRLRDPKRFRAYAFGILHRRGADYIRAAMTARARATEADPTSQLSQQPPQDERSALNQAFSALPPEQRLAAHLHFVEGLTLPEIAEAQSIPTGTAKSRLFHARRKLKAALTDTPQGDDT